MVGRAQLPSNVLGLLFNAAEHTQRQTGQVRYVHTELARAPEQLAEWRGRLAVVVPGKIDDVHELADISRKTIHLLPDMIASKLPALQAYQLSG